MITDKIKIRISEFAYRIIYHDSTAFEITKSDGSPNINSFLNKVIPNLLLLRKQRRKQIHDIMTEAMQYNADKITQEHLRLYMDTIIDEVYFSDDELDDLSESIWIRPKKEYLSIFDEIAESETEITQMELSTYIRSLLNEYIRLPQYKRESICFMQEMDILKISCFKKKIINLTYGEKTFRVSVINYIYGYLSDQANYIICYDIKNDVLKSFLLHKISKIYPLEKTFILDDRIFNAFYGFIKNNLFKENETYQINTNNKTGN